MPRLNTTKQAAKLHSALIKRGIDAFIEKWDGHKHVDISIPNAKLYIEIDGNGHFTDAKTIERDLVRDQYSSNDGYETFRVPNCVIDEEIQAVVNAICKVVRDRRG